MTDILETLLAEKLPECSFDGGKTWVLDGVRIAEVFAEAAKKISVLRGKVALFSEMYAKEGHAKLVLQEDHSVRDAALRKIARGDYNCLAGNPDSWPSTIAYFALGGRVEDGVMLDNFEDHFE
jgi:hypothetical protein